MKIKGSFQEVNHLDQSMISPYSAGAADVPSAISVDINHGVSIEIEFSDPDDLAGAKRTIIDQMIAHPIFTITESDIIFELTD